MIISEINNTYLSNKFRMDRLNKPLEEVFHLEYNMFQASKKIEYISIIDSIKK